MQEYLAESHYINWSDPELSAWSSNRVSGNDDRERAISLYKAVRDEFTYNPFFIVLEPKELQASRIIEKGYGHCVAKATFLIACLRQQGIPSRLGLARVKNHMSTDQLEKILRTNVLVPHGYVDVWLEGMWIKCTPAFNVSLCEKLGVAVLEFDGHTDSIFQEYDREGADFMEYVEDYGGFADVPLDFIKKVMFEEYPHLFDEDGKFDPTRLARL